MSNGLLQRPAARAKDHRMLGGILTEAAYALALTCAGLAVCLLLRGV